MQEDERLVLTPFEVSKLLRCSRGVVYESLRRKIIPSIRLGRKIIIPRVKFLDWLNGGGSSQLQQK